MQLREITQSKSHKIPQTEGMGGSSGGGTAGSGGAGGSSLGLPYPSTYEEENDKFKTYHPIDKNKRPMHNLSMTTEEEDEAKTIKDRPKKTKKRYTSTTAQQRELAYVESAAFKKALKLVENYLCPRERLTDKYM